MSNPVVRAIGARIGDPRARAYGEAGTQLAELLEAYPVEQLVEAVGRAVDGWGLPLIIAELHNGELRRYLDHPPAAPAPVDETAAREALRARMQDEGAFWWDRDQSYHDEPEPAPAFLESPDPLVQKFARFAPVVVTPPCQNGGREESA